MSVSVGFERASAKVYGSERKGIWKRAAWERIKYEAVCLVLGAGRQTRKVITCGNLA